MAELTIRELLLRGQDILQKENIDNFQYDAKALLLYVLGCDNTGFYLRMQEPAEPEVVQRYMEAIKKRSTHYPLQYITESQGFMGYDFLVNENVLIPRQDTELLVEQALKAAKEKETGRENTPLRVLDLCTGSGCIGISFYLQRLEQGRKDDVTLADISQGALLVARENARRLGASVKLVLSDLFATLEPGESGSEEQDAWKFDMILSNPPYIESAVIPTLMPEVKDYEPMGALDGAADGLYFYREIIEKAGTFLNENGELLLEIGYNQYEAVKGLLVAKHFTDIRLTRDYAGLDRVVSARYCKERFS
jgi:release factor glutamine methyltransferase